jgi:uncharacterized membrane protein
VNRPLILSSGGVGAIAIAARIPGAVNNALWQDEVASARIISKSNPFDMVFAVARGESTPPVWYSLGWLVHHLGVSVPDVRVLSVLAGGAAAALVVIYAARFVPLPAAVVAGLITALGSQFMRHGWELRAYALFTLVSVVFAFLVERAAEQPDRRRLAWLAACVAVGTLTHYFFFLAMFASFVWLWWTCARDVAKRVTVAMAVGLIPFAIWLPAFVHQYTNGRFMWIGPFDAIDVPDVYRELLLAHLGLDVRWLVLAVVLAGCVLLARSPRGRHPALLATLPVIVAALAWLIGSKVFDPRNLLVAAPFAAIAVSAAVAALPRSAAVVAGLVVLALIAVDVEKGRGDPPPHYDRIAHRMQALGWQPSDPIVVIGAPFAMRGPLQYYLNTELHLGTRTRGTCPVVFLVDPNGTVRRGGPSLFDTPDTNPFGAPGSRCLHLIPG